MNSSKILTVFVSGVALFLSLFVIQSVLTSGGNSLSRLFLFLGIAGAVLGFLNPRWGIFFLIVAGFYLDLMKRFLIIEGSIGILDLVQVLAFAPITFAGVLAGQLVKGLFNPKLFARRELVAFIVSVLLSGGLIGVGLMKRGFDLRVIAEIGSQAAYVSFIWIAFYYLKTLKQQRQFFNFALICFVPVLLYAYKQLIFGYSDLEVNYALSGLTIVDNPLLKGRVEYYRIFSTLSSSGAYGLMAIVVGTYSLLAYVSKSNINVLLARLFGVLCLASLIPGAGKTGWAVAAMVLFCSFMFRKKFSTILIYISTAVAFSFLFFAGDRVIDAGAQLTEGAADSAWEERTFQVGTFTARTDSIKNWTQDPKYFSWFGIREENRTDFFIHDMLGEIYVGFGIVGLSSAVLIMLVGLYLSHRGVLRIDNLEEKKFNSFILALTYGLLVGSIVSGGGIRIFPVVFYFWACVGILCVSVFRRRGKKGDINEEDSLKLNGMADDGVMVPRAS